MKKFFLSAVCIISVLVADAQSLEEIIRKYTIANKLDKVSGFKTIKITGNMSMMGMEAPVEMWMKNPDKIKTVTTISGQKIIHSFDGEKGYMVNPMTGSSGVKEISLKDVKQILRTSVFQNYLDEYYKKGNLSLAGEDVVKGKPAFKIKATIEGGSVLLLFIDKTSYHLIKTSAEVTQGGIPMTVDTYPSDYRETNGIILPMRTTTSASGMEFVTTFTKVEVDTPVDDSFFKIN